MKWLFFAAWAFLVACGVVLLLDGHFIYASFADGISTYPLYMATCRAMIAAQPPLPEFPEKYRDKELDWNAPIDRETWIVVGFLALGIVVSVALWLMGMAPWLMGMAPPDAPGWFLFGIAFLLWFFYQSVLLAGFTMLIIRRNKNQNGSPNSSSNA